MTTNAANLLAEIRRSGGDVMLVGDDRLKLVAPKALLPVLTDRVRAAKPVLLAALADTASQVSTAQEGGEGVLSPRRNTATVQHRTAWSPSERVIPDWRARHREAVTHWSAFHPADEAARLAWAEMQLRWHQLHGRRVPEWQCAGCGESIGGLAALALTDGNRVHLNKLDCLLSYGERWRTAATCALMALGLRPPAAGSEAP